MRSRLKLMLMAMMVMLLSVVQINVNAAEENKIVISTDKATMNVGDEMKLTVTGTGKTPTWVSFNEKIVEVDQTGTVTALKAGTAKVQARVGRTYLNCQVKVVNSSLKLNKKSATIYCGGTSTNTVELKATTSGATKNAQDVVWESSAPAVASVDKVTDEKGKVKVIVTGKSAGTATITATANGKTASCDITVKNTEVALNFDDVQLSTKGSGKSLKLRATVTGSNNKIKWESKDKKVATVSGGTVTAKSEGQTEITATANGVTTTCIIRVTDGLVSITDKRVELFAGTQQPETKQLKTNASKKDVLSWKSSNENVVSVDHKGKITAKAAGTAIVTVTCNGKTDSCEVIVKQTRTDITANSVTLCVKGNDKTCKLGVNVVGRKSNITWKSSDTKVVTVSNGKLTAKKEGAAVVMATANGVTDSVTVIVQPYKPSISLNYGSYKLYTGIGNKMTLKAKVDGASKKVNWSSSNNGVVTVDKNGAVTAKSAGNATITATANGSSAECKIQVIKTAITFEQTGVSINKGEKISLAVDVTGASQNIKWSTTNAKVATVKNGIVTGKAMGKAEIKATANGVTAVCQVVVTDCVHEYDTAVTTKPTCVDTGLQTYTCKKCGFRYDEIMPALGGEHSFNRVETTKQATCIETGIQKITCTKCGYSYEEIIPALGHEISGWVTETPATETTSGVEERKCVRCNGEKETREIPATLAGGYKLKWEDNFGGNSLNSADWNVELHNPGWVNNELQAYVDSTDNIYVKDGNLIIQAIKTADGYTSGRVNTQNKHDYKYGRFEARAKVPSGQGFLPAFWMMPTDENLYGQWPKCGEIDIMEVLGSQTNRSYSTLHFGEPHTERQGSFVLHNGTFADDFHVFACEWEPGKIRFFVDDQLVAEQNDWFTKKQGFGEVAYPAPFDQPFYMILNLAVGGNWPGNPDETTAFDENARLTVDYVRVYRKDSYDENVTKPEKEVVLREPDATGNYVINGDFSDTAMGENEAWNLLTALGGEATAEIKDNALHIHTTNAGTVDYSVQIVQPGIPMEKNYTYTLSFDAYASENRTMKTGITAPDNGYIRYFNDTVVGLTTEKKHYEYTFKMTSATDANGRLEFNLGNQSSIADVIISNVRIERSSEPDTADEQKSVLPDGNYVYNGEFNEGTGRLAYWGVENKNDAAKTYVSNENNVREFTIEGASENVSLDDITLTQTDIAIGANKKYIFSFTAYADSAKQAKAIVAGQELDIDLTAKKKDYRFELTTGACVNRGDLVFQLGLTGKVCIDKIRIEEDCLLMNGDFSNGMTGFEVFADGAANVSGYTVDSLNEDNAFSIDIANTGGQDWHIQLKQNNIKLEQGKCYRIKLDAKSEIDRKIMYALQRDGSSDNDWTPYSGSQKIDITPEWQTFETVFKMTYPTDEKVILSISMGAFGESITTKHFVRIDNIVLEEVDESELPKEDPIEPKPNGVNLIQNGNFANGGEGWTNSSAENAAEVSFADEKAVYIVKNVGENDWDVQLKQDNLTLEKGEKYKLSLKMKSTAARTVKVGLLDSVHNYAWYGGADVQLTADQEYVLDQDINITEASSDTITFQISMGKIANEKTPLSTIEIADVSLIKYPLNETPVDSEPEDPKPVEGNLIKNGDFLEGKENWISYVHAEAGAEATATFTDKKAVYEIANVGTADWNIQLKQEGITLEKDAEYEIRFTVKSTEARSIRYALLTSGDDWYGGEDIELKANESLKYVGKVKITKPTDNNMKFQISMGKLGDTPLSTIEIDDISLVKVSDAPAPQSDEVGVEKESESETETETEEESETETETETEEESKTETETETETESSIEVETENEAETEVSTQE